MGSEVKMALASMTGFGRGRGELSRRFAASVVIRSVNHKYLDVQVKTNLREETPELEAAIRRIVSSSVNRGRVTVQVNLEKTAPPDAETLVDGEALARVIEQLRAIEGELNLQDSLELRDVLSIPGLVTVTMRETLLEDGESEALETVVRAAMDEYLAMRNREASRLLEQLDADLGSLSAFLDQLEPELEGIRATLHDRLKERIERLLGPDMSADPERLIQEAAMLADRADVSEEVTRLRSHIATFADRLSQGGAVGRTLDFLCQEMHRELNTLGSKCREVGVAERLVEAKAATERIREQVQNLE